MCSSKWRDSLSTISTSRGASAKHTHLIVQSENIFTPTKVSVGLVKIYILMYHEYELVLQMLQLQNKNVKWQWQILWFVITPCIWDDKKILWTDMMAIKTIAFVIIFLQQHSYFLRYSAVHVYCTPVIIERVVLRNNRRLITQ